VTPAALIDALWTAYVAVTPQAQRIHHLLAARGDVIANDHLALRTFAVPGLGLDAVAGAFEKLGWTACERPRIHAEAARERSWQHPDPELPRLLLGEVLVHELSPRAQAIIGGLVAQLPPGFDAHRALVHAERPWRLTHADYCTLRAESAPAAWIAALGLRVHHVAVDVTALATFPDLVALDAFLSEHGFALDERFSTRPEAIEVAFADGVARIPSGTYGFTLRARRGRERREVVVELEQHVDVHADELHAHAGHRGPAYDRR